MIGDFNVDKNLKDFCQFYILKHLVEVPICYKYLNNPSIKDLMLANSHCSFRCYVELNRFIRIL